MPAADTSTAASCEHCDDSTPHSHVDEGPLISGYRRSARIASLAALVLAVLATLVSMIWDRSAALTALAGLVSWFVAIVIGLLVFGWLQRSRTTAVAVIAGAIANGAVTPLLAWAVGSLSSMPVPMTAIAAASGWLLLGAVANAHQAVRLAAVLHAPTRDGEAARDAVVRTRGKPNPWIESAWLIATAVLFGAYAAATMTMPALVAVLVPLNVALAMLTRRWQARAAHQAGSALR
ncbi:MAG: hypothetical protein ACK5H2_00530 [Beutenbergiaceae bacterium]